MDWVFYVNDALEVTRREQRPGREALDSKLGEKDGAAIYCSDPLLADFDAGTPEAVIDYGEFYLVVSRHRTGVMDAPPTVSATWYTQETVYSAYGPDGALLFRASSDGANGTI